MKFLSPIFISLIFSITAAYSSATFTSSISAQEKQGIQNFVESALRSRSHAITKVGIMVRSLDNGEIIYQRNANQLMIPASVQKLLTAIAGLAYLGPNFTFNTSLLTDGSVHNGILDGNLVVKFSGDPSLKAADVSNLFRQLAAQGVRQIQGSVFIDNGDYNPSPYGAGWVQKDFNYYYAAPLNAIIINENTFNLILKPSQPNRQAIITSNLPPLAANFHNSLITTTGPRRACSVAIHSDQYNNYHISGCLVKKWGIQTSLLAIKDPNNYAKALVRQSLAQNHIRFNGIIKMHHDMAAQKSLVVHQSAPLKTLIIRMLKKSDNMFANTLLKKIGQVYFRTTGTWENGAQAVKDIINQKAHINLKDSIILDGAGLSHFNLLTPNQLSALLDYAYHDRNIAPYLISALPLSGVDGTLKHRMPHFQVRGKTGTLQSVSSLAGYLVTSKKHHLSFVIMVNGYKGRCYPYTHFQDQICQYLAHNA
ncbi:MAG TPA: D-alanyl-D-alanine carboxypeptidase/D-alanyl-D-alanine-endopeptidase [Coxiellaceae bacterium]|nr:D-alanyl-D-alanine carboxypeptidase/D-alanyl-D-alanine-endopeptidase [Coxiellaceae bacterium]